MIFDFNKKVVEDIFYAIKDGFTRTLKDLNEQLGIFVNALGEAWYHNQRVYWRSRYKALDRSRRNNQTVKRYKHGRTQRTRVKR